jgi:hypothetical protein
VAPVEPIPPVTATTIPLPDDPVSVALLLPVAPLLPVDESDELVGPPEVELVPVPVDECVSLEEPQPTVRAKKNASIHLRLRVASEEGELGSKEKESFMELPRDSRPVSESPQADIDCSRHDKCHRLGRFSFETCRAPDPEQTSAVRRSDLPWYRCFVQKNPMPPVVIRHSCSSMPRGA